MPMTGLCIFRLPSVRTAASPVEQIHGRWVAAFEAWSHWGTAASMLSALSHDRDLEASGAWTVARRRQRTRAGDGAPGDLGPQRCSALARSAGAACSVTCSARCEYSGRLQAALSLKPSSLHRPGLKD